MDKGLVYIGVNRKNLTNGRYYPMNYNHPHYCIKDNCGALKMYHFYKNEWFKKNFKIMLHDDYILWARAVKLKKLKNETVLENISD